MIKWLQRAGLIPLFVYFTIADDLRGGADHEGLWADMVDIWNDCPMSW